MDPLKRRGSAVCTANQTRHGSPGGGLLGGSGGVREEFKTGKGVGGARTPGELDNALADGDRLDCCPFFSLFPTFTG